MNDDNDFDLDFDADDEPPEAIMTLLSASAEWLLADPEPKAFIARMSVEGPSRFADMLETDPNTAVLRARHSSAEHAAHVAGFFRSLAWAIVSAMPLPSNDFKPRKLPLPGRNEACVCGSGKKFKQCCSPFFQHLPELPPELLGGLVVRALPVAQWPALHARHATPGMVTAAAELLSNEGRADDAMALLEPWAQLPAPWPDSRADLLDVLGDLYLEAGRQPEREQLARDMVRHGGKEMQSLGWQRLCLLATDAGDEGAAREAFEKAQRLTPNDPRVALLEVTTLLGQGDAERARERAAFHAKRLSRLANAMDMVDAIEALAELADPDSELSRRTDAMMGGPALPQVLIELEQWLEALPSPKLRLTLPKEVCDDLGQLKPTATVKKALKLWDETFGPTPTLMAWHTSGREALEVLASKDWIAVLQAHPVLGDSFEVLDALLMMVNEIPVDEVAPLRQLLVERAQGLWALLIEQQPGALCEWAHWGNRAALRLLVEFVQLDDSRLADMAYPWLVQLVRVRNPHDNHGLRQRLVAVYLRRNEPALALSLCEYFPGDMLGMTLLHARALLAAGRLPEAAAMLGQALKRNTHARTLLQSTSAPSMPEVPGYRTGSVEEARIALANQFDLWRDDKAVRAWLVKQLEADGAAGIADVFD